MANLANPQPEAVDVVDPLAPKPGWNTSEFWVTSIPVLALVLRGFGVDVDEGATSELALGVGGAVAGVYALARTFLKIARLNNSRF